jgi:hypothetical protein
MSEYKWTAGRVIVAIAAVALLAYLVAHFATGPDATEMQRQDDERMMLERCVNARLPALLERVGPKYARELAVEDCQRR